MMTRRIKVSNMAKFFPHMGYVQLVQHNQTNESIPHFQSLPLLTNIRLWCENKVK
jgi:hypothetical protein